MSSSKFHSKFEKHYIITKYGYFSVFLLYCKGSKQENGYTFSCKKYYNKGKASFILELGVYTVKSHKSK